MMIYRAWIFLALVAYATVGSATASDVMAARTLPIGSIVELSDLELADEVEPSAADSFVGKEIKRAVYVGRAISESDVGPATIIKRNEIIRLHYNLNGLGIRTEARALESGGLGEEISVMNIDTRITVRASIVGRKRARVIR